MPTAVVFNWGSAAS